MKFGNVRSQTATKLVEGECGMEYVKVTPINNEISNSQSPLVFIHIEAGGKEMKYAHRRK